MLSLSDYLNSAYAYLSEFALSDLFWGNFETVYGTEYDFAKADAIRTQWTSQDFSDLPAIEVVSSEVLGSAQGAYAASTSTIYLSDAFLATATSEQVVAVILEEIGHYVDAQVNSTDTPGDEGAVFAAVVQGAELDSIVPLDLRTEDDSGGITVAGQTVAVEKADPIVVNSFGDQGDANLFDDTPDSDLITPGVQTTLRSAIDFANAVAGVDTITFNLPESSNYVISPNAALPEITESIIIDGTTQPGFSERPIVTLDGSNLSDGDGLVISAGNSIVRGLVIHGFPGYGVVLKDNGNNQIESNEIRGNGSGVFIDNISDNRVGGTDVDQRNVIGGGLNGVQISGGLAQGNVVQGNYIGVDEDGSDLLGTTGVVIENGASNNLIGGTIPEARNIISDNGGTGISIIQSDTNIIQGNYIGTDPTGEVDLGNGSGIIIFSGNNNQIGGITAEARNVISGNNGYGISSFGDSTIIQGNYIGTDKNGTIPLGNTFSGISLGINSSGDSSGTVIGGTTSGEGNIVAFNGDNGIYMDISSGSNITIVGNAIFSNDQDGINIDSGSNITMLENSIFDNSGHEIEIFNSTNIGINIQSNIIFNNGLLGIELGGDGVNPNDIGDIDNGIQNHPNIFSVTENGDNTITIEALLASAPETDYTVEFFSISEADPSGYGEGQYLLGSTDVITDVNGNALVTATAPIAIIGSQFITATATGGQGTSEFSQAFPVTLVGNADGIIPIVTLAVNPGSASENGTVNIEYAFTRTSDTTSDLVVTTA